MKFYINAARSGNEYDLRNVFARKKAIFTDIDQTLRRDKIPVEKEMANVIIELALRLGDGRFGVISGSGIESITNSFAKPVCEQMNERGQFPKIWMMANYGGTAFVIDKGTVVPVYEEERLDINERRLINYALSSVFRREHIYNFEKVYKGSQVSIGLLGNNSSSEERMGYDPDGTKRMALTKMLRRLIPQRLEVFAAGMTSIDITRINKAMAVEKLAELNGLKKNDILYFGDAMFEGGNDYPVRINGVDCIGVRDPEETKRMFESLIKILGRNADLKT